MFYLQQTDPMIYTENYYNILYITDKDVQNLEKQVCPYCSKKTRFEEVMSHITNEAGSRCYECGHVAIPHLLKQYQYPLCPYHFDRIH